MSGARKSRKERAVETYREQFVPDALADDDAATIVEKAADEHVDEENRLLWALYRHLDVSQREAVGMVDPIVGLSQSTASRVIRDMADEVLLEHSDKLGEAGDDGLRSLEHHSEPYLEAYRDVLATTIVRREALERLGSPEHDTPTWAREEFPELAGEDVQFSRAAGVPKHLIQAEEPPADSDTANTGGEADD
jgi:hypothetical protein